MNSLKRQAVSTQAILSPCCSIFPILIQVRLFKHFPFVLLLIVLLGGSVRGQNRHFIFESPLSGNSFSASSVTRIFQDRQGFLWFGTWSGLARYDGYDLRIFCQNNIASCGLAGNKITCLYEDPNGALWVGTRNTGLYRFNRATEHFESCSVAFGAKEDPPAHNITSVFRDRNGRFWIGAEEGLLMFDPVQKSFFTIPLKSRTPEPGQNLYLYSIQQTDDGSIWVGGSHGLFRGDGNAAMPVLEQVPLHDESIAASSQFIEFQNFVYAVRISAQNPNILWVGTKHGLKRLNFTQGDWTHPVLQSFTHADQDPNSLSHDFVVDICETDFPAKNSLWLATFNGLNLLENADAPGVKPAFRHFFANENKEDGLLGNSIRALQLDRNQILWIATDRGLNKLDARSSIFSLVPLRRAPGHMPDPVSHLSCSDHAIWASTFGSGFFRIPLHDGKPDWQATARYSLSVSHCSPVADFISAIIPDQNGNVWLATQGAGAYCIKESDLLTSKNYVERARHFTKGAGPLGISDDYLMSMMTDSGNRIWIGGWDGGLNCIDPARKEALRFPGTSDGKVDFRQMPVVSLVEASKEEAGDERSLILWAGTRGGGLFQLKFDAQNGSLLLLKRFTSENHDQTHISHNAVTSIARDRKGQLWICTEGGVDRWNEKEQAFETQNMYGGLPQAPFQAILEDPRQYFWVSTQNGLARLDPSANWQSVSYNMRNGLRDRFFNSNAALALPDGEMLFGGNTGITVFDPADIQPDPNPPITALVGLRLFNQPVNPGVPVGEDSFVLKQSLAELPELVLSHRENVVSFEFTGLHLECPEQNRFAYRLKGFDPDWIYTDASKRLAHYTNLPPGDYVFEVKSANSDNVWNERPVQLNVSVLPAWWWSIPAKLLYLLLLAGLIAGVGRAVFLRARYQHQIHFERLEKQKLEEVNQMKLAFFTNISHELKTPLTLIISPLEEIIQDEQRQPAGSNQTFRRMHRNAMRLLTMINQLLDIRKAEAGLMRIEVTENDLVQFVREVCNSFNELAEQKNIALHFYSDLPEVMAWFDRDYMEKVFFNLLSNALKFTESGGIVTITVDEDKDSHRFWVSVEDSGKGIEAEKIRHIFDPFYQAEEHHESGFTGGSGIGLSLVKTIIERHHGTVEVQSEPGKGSVFTVWLPSGNEMFTEEEKKAGKNAPSGQSPLRRSAGAFFPDNAEPAMPHSPQPHRETLLLVEDNQDIRGYLHEHLSGAYHIIEAEDGAKGLLAAMENPPDLVICDISMPGMDGLEFTRQLKCGMVTSHIPVILLTARNSLGFRINGLEAGADDYVTKPFNLRLLEIRIKNLISGRKKLREAYSKALSMPEKEIQGNVIHLNSLDDTFMIKVLEAIEHHIEIPEFSVDDLAKKLLMSRKQVYRKIKALTDQTPNELIRTVRLKKAAQLLKSHQYTVAEVTYKVGFQDLKYFRERFREVYGVTPSEYTG